MNDRIGASHDDRIIEIDKADELAYWVKFFGTSNDELLAAISEVGPLAQMVRDHLLQKAERFRGGA
jgi:hypothetical protein